MLFRNACRTRSKLNNSYIAKLLVSNCQLLWKEDPIPEHLNEIAQQAQGNRLTDLCDVCGYGSCAPPMNTDILLEENQFGRAVVLSTIRLSHNQQDSHEKMTTYKSIEEQWNGFLTIKQLGCVKSFLEEGSRGRMLKCVECGCVIHEKCLDCPSYHVVSSDSQFSCPN